MKKSNLLIIDDNLSILDVYSEMLDKHFTVTTCDTEEKAILITAEENFEVVLLDMGLNPLEEDAGLRVLSHIKKFNPNTEVVVLTAYASVDIVRQSFKKGAFDYIVKGKPNTHGLVTQFLLEANSISIKKEKRKGKARVFIGSSVEGLDIAYAIQENLEIHHAEVVVWDQGVFELSKNTLEELFGALSEFDFAIFVFTPDDAINMRKKTVNKVRDNVLFEMGLFMGKYGLDRVFYIIPSTVDNFELPTDLAGITPGKYTSDRSDNNLKSATSPFCNKFRKKMETIGLRDLHC